MPVDRPEALERPEALGRPDEMSSRADGRDSAGEREFVDRRGASGLSDDLGKRLDSLPDGHPSSRYEEDGSPRESAVDLRSLDSGPDDDASEALPDRIPVTDAYWSERIDDVRADLDNAQCAGLPSNRTHTIDKAGKIWSEERDLIHEAIIEDVYKAAEDVPNEHKAIIAGGLGGAGKTTVLSERAGIDLSKYLTINPDNIKEELAERGLIPEVAGLTPMEASDLVHEESSHIAKRIAHRAEADGKNVIWDITMSSYDSTKDRIDNLRADGYSVEGIFVDIPIELAISRADDRHREGHEKWLAGNGLGGRYVPPEVITAQADPDWGSKNRKTFERVCGLFDRWSRYDNSVHGRPAVLTDTSSADPKKREETA